MEEFEQRTYCERAALELAALVHHQRRPRGRTRHDSAVLRHCVREMLGWGVSPNDSPAGPWRVGRRPLRRRGRGGLDYIPLVERGDTTIMLSTLREAEELAAVLNWCGMEEFGGGGRKRGR